MELRPYQQEAREAVQREWLEGRKRTLLVLPTGTGKPSYFQRSLKIKSEKGSACSARSQIRIAGSSKRQTKNRDGPGTALEKS